MQFTFETSKITRLLFKHARRNFAVILKFAHTFFSKAAFNNNYCLTVNFKEGRAALFYVFFGSCSVECVNSNLYLHVLKQ